MKRPVIFLFVILGFISTSCILTGWDNHVSGNGHVITETRDISGFTGVHVSSGIDVLLTEDDEFHVTLEADENLHEVIKTYVKGDMLVVGTENVNIRNAKSKKVHVSLPHLTDLKISSAGDCDGENMFHCGDLILDVSSAGDLKLEVESEKIDLNISSSGDVRLTGKTGELNANLSSAGDLDAFDLIARKVEVDASSAGDARVHATEEISMNASSAGNIYYTGSAKVIRSRTSSAGDIVKK